ncbi:hypothetical protein ABZP36_001623 [Zizania latifolia]
MLQHTQSVNRFFGTYASISCCLTRFNLYNATVAESNLNHLLLNTCNQLQHLYLYHCDVGYLSIFKICDPNSKLISLEFSTCVFEQVMLVCLRKLERFLCGYWGSTDAPLSLGYVACLKQVEIFNHTTHYQRRFKLCELLCDTTSIETNIGFHWRKGNKHSFF